MNFNHHYKTFTEAYKSIITDVYEYPDFICSPRGQKIKEKLGFKFIIENPRARLPFIKERDLSISYIIAEAIWYLTGNDSTSWISYYSKFWESISDDGSTANSAYGSRIFKPHHRISKEFQCDTWTQWCWLIDELVNDNDSRRAIIHIRSPQDSRFAIKDVPCTLTLQFFIRNDKLHQVVSMRSSDCVLGIANDVPAFTLFQELLALQLSEKLQRKIELGSYIHESNSLHIYERNFEQVEKIITSKLPENILAMPEMVSVPPLERLSKYENLIRNSNEPTLVLNSIIGLESYWRDWLIILASHRYGKLNDKVMQQKMLQLTKWEGFQYFNR